MKPTNNFNTTAAASNSVTPMANLPGGGYACLILKAEEAVSAKGTPCLNLYIDIADGEFKGYFMSQFENKKKFNPEVKYKGILRQLTTDADGNTSPYFKGLISAIEDSNPGYHWDWNEKALKGKKLGIVFREEAWEYNGYSGMAAKPLYACNVNDAPAMPVPAPKGAVKKQEVTAPAMTETTDYDLPF